MPSETVHFGKAKSFIRAVNLLTTSENPETLIDPVAAALKAHEVFGSKPAKAFKTLYNFSRIARYSQDKSTEARSKEGHLEQDSRALSEVIRRLDRCVEKIRELTKVSQSELPSVVARADSP